MEAAGYTFKVKRCKVKQCGQNRSRKGKTDTGRLQLEVDTANDQHYKKARDNGIE